MKFRVGAALFGLGVLLLVLAAGLPLYVKPSVSRLPYDLKPSTSVAVAPNAKFMQTKVEDGKVSIEVREGTLQSTIEVVPQAQTTKTLPAGLRDETVAWDVFQTVVWKEQNEIINGYSTGIALDRVSAAAVDWDEQWLDDSGQQYDPRGGKARPAAVNIKYSGQTYKFPFGTEKKTYEYYDRDLRKALPVEFKGTEKIHGLEVYRFEQVIDKQTQDVPADRLALLFDRFAKGATSGRIEYSNTRTLWVEPVTGQYLKVSEKQRKELVPNTGGPTVLLDATFTYTEETTKKAADTASSNIDKLALVGLYLPIGLGVLALLCIAGGVLLILRGGKPATPRHRVADTPAA